MTDDKKRQRKGREPAHEKNGQQYNFVCAGVLVAEGWHCYAGRNMVAAFISRIVRPLLNYRLACQESQKRLVVRR